MLGGIAFSLRDLFGAAGWSGNGLSGFRSFQYVRVEDGKLKIQTRWEPEFNFSKKPDSSYTDAEGQGRAYENITTAAVIARRQFLYGYMEIKCKAADASITSSFWGTGRGSELDVFEFVGNPSQGHKAHLKKEYKFTMIDWANPGGFKRVWQEKHELDWEATRGFHVYGCEWDERYLKFFADGELVGGVTKAELGEKWVLEHPLWVWVDSETFPWDGLPDQHDLPADYEIEYIRIWQKK